MAARKRKADDISVTVPQKDGDITIRRGGNPATSYPVVDHVVTVGADDPNLGRLQALTADTTTPETPADPKE